MDSSKLERVADQEHNIDEGDDMISLLPDSILHHILSYIPTKEIVATAVLSKRWKYLWTSIPILDIDDSLLHSDPTDLWHPKDVTRFMKIIDRVFLMRDGSTLIRFRLSSCISFRASRVYDWIATAIHHHVEELDLCLYVEQPFMFPGCLFCNPKILVLKLRMDCILNLTPDISLPSLKVLHLRRVTFPSDTLMQSLFSSCPSLTELAMLDCECMNLRSISIAMPSLKILAIYDFSVRSSGNIEGCKISIDAGNLRLFIYGGNLHNEINIHDISTSAVASIDIPILGGGQREISDRTFKLFRGLTNVGCLKVSEDTLKYLFLAGYIPTFRNLKLLNLTGKFGKYSTELLIKFLQHLPKLESFRVCEGLDHYGEDGELAVGQNCVLSSLKTVNYHNLRATNTEIRFLSFLLQNAIVLEKMNIFWSTSFAKEPSEREEIRDLLQGRCSHCVLTLT